MYVFSVPPLLTRSVSVAGDETHLSQRAIVTYAMEFAYVD